jgi:Immunity protein 53
MGGAKAVRWDRKAAFQQGDKDERSHTSCPHEENTRRCTARKAVGEATMTDGLIDDITWLENWYLSHCDGDWEHSYGVRIETLDNPGWSISIDLTGTALAGHPYQTLTQLESESDWIHCRVVDFVWHGNSDPRGLGRLVRVFREWVEASA